MRMLDVCIIGAGPAGCVAARELARAGFRVVVLEEHQVIGSPVDCSGVIGTEAFERLSLPRRAIRDQLQQLEFVSPSGKRVYFDPRRTLAYLVDRAAFDRSLADQAGDAGAEILTGATVKTVEVSPSDVRLTIAGSAVQGSFRAHVVLLANGPRYQFQLQLGMGRPSQYLKTVQAEIELGRAEPPRVFLGSRVAPGSFAWWLPVNLGGRYRVKIGSSTTGDSQRAFHAFLDLLCVQGYLERNGLPARAWMIPISTLPRTYSDRVLAVGDAAGQTKPTTGGGLYYGLLCAQMAAQVIGEGLRCGDVSARFLARYEQRWRELLGPELRMAQRFRRLYERLSDAEIDALFDLASQDGLLEELTAEADFDWHRRAILTVIRRPPFARLFFRSVLGDQLSRLVS